MAGRRRERRTEYSPPHTEAYCYPDSFSPLRPDVGTQPQFRKRKPPATYRYDSSLSPALDWDGQNHARELGEWLIAAIEEAAQLGPPHVFPQPKEFNAGEIRVYGLHDAVSKLKEISGPFLNWSGKAEHLSFDVPTLPLFVHERLSTKSIIETLKCHRRKQSPTQLSMMELFGDPQHSVVDQVLKAYEYQDRWVNRLILGDSLVVMNSLLHYEGLGGQVQMIYMDPPYGVKFGSNFQPFVRRRDVKHNDDDDMTREPEMVKAYRDTWELGLHSYLSYLRDRLWLARELLHASGSVFVQISDENMHHVRELLDEVFGAGNFCSVITFAKTSGQTTSLVPAIGDFLLWYAKDRRCVKFHQLYAPKVLGEVGAAEYSKIELPDGRIIPMSSEQMRNPGLIPPGGRIFATDSLVSEGFSAGNSQDIELEHHGRNYILRCGPKRHWKVSPDGVRRLWDIGRLLRQEGVRIYKRYFDDFPYMPLDSIWSDTRGEPDMLYAVQTSRKVVQRCLLMTTDPGDLVLDPTCGGGTTAYVAEQWGRRWIAIDISRVPLALTRQRLLTATFPYYRLRDESRGPTAGFVYTRKQNDRGEEVGGVVPHVTLRSLAYNEPPKEEVLVDRPEIDRGVIRVTGPFCVDGTIPTPVELELTEGQEEVAAAADEGALPRHRMLEILRRSPVLYVGGNKTVTFKDVRPPAKTLSLSAEAIVANGEERPVAFVFGPENGAVSEKLVYEAAREAHAKSFGHLYVVGFAIEPNARMLVENCEAAVGVPATYVQATPDIVMGDLLKSMRSSQIFSVCGLPDVKLCKVPESSSNDQVMYQVELLGVDVFDPVTMTADHRPGDDVPTWFLETDYNGLCFHVCQAFFPRTSAWDSLKKALKGLYEESVWDHLSGTKSAPFEAGDHGQVAVKVIDDRGNELMVVRRIEEAEG